jgi:hypothetical protein
MQVEVSLASERLSTIVSIFRRVGDNILSLPLLVDEGYLFVEENGVLFYLCVDK